MSSTYGTMLRLSIFGQSHGKAIGMTLDGVPAGLSVDFGALQTFLDRRAPGKNDWSTPRREADEPEFLSGLLDAHTCGAPIAAVIANRNTRSGDYDSLKDCPRPGHADFTAQIKYGGWQDSAGGGHFSGRLTAPLCIAGGLCKQWLEMEGIQVGAHIVSISDCADRPFDPITPELNLVNPAFPVLEQKAGDAMRHAIARARADGDSVGGIIECAAVGLPVGLGEPMFGGMDSRIAQLVYGIPAVRGVDFGAGFSSAYLPGSRCNDEFFLENGAVRTKTNRCGGILGGITTGMPLIFQVAFKPTPSIARPQQTVCLSTGEAVTLEISGRHDPCIVPRAVPVVEAAAAIALYDALLEWKARK